MICTETRGKIEGLVDTLKDENIELAKQLCEGQNLNLLDCIDDDLRSLFFMDLSHKWDEWRYTVEDFLKWLKMKIKNNNYYSYVDIPIPKSFKNLPITQFDLYNGENH